MNANRPNPREYNVGDTVMVRRKIQSKKVKGIVDKVQYAYTGPWEITKKLHGASYEVRHTASGQIDKKHAMHITPMPQELVSFAPLDDVDTMRCSSPRGA